MAPGFDAPHFLLLRELPEDRKDLLGIGGFEQLMAKLRAEEVLGDCPERL